MPHLPRALVRPQRRRAVPDGLATHRPHFNAWLWVFSSNEATLYVIRSGAGARGHQVPEDLLGPDFDGYLVVDGLRSYDVLEVAKGRCNGHLLRRCKDLHDVVPGRE